MRVCAGPVLSVGGALKIRQEQTVQKTCQKGETSTVGSGDREQQSRLGFGGSGRQHYPSLRFLLEQSRHAAEGIILPAFA